MTDAQRRLWQKTIARLTSRNDQVAAKAEDWVEKHMLDDSDAVIDLIQRAVEIKVNGTPLDALLATFAMSKIGELLEKFSRNWVKEKA